LKNVQALFYDVRAQKKELADVKLIIPAIRMHVLGGLKVALKTLHEPLSTGRLSNVSGFIGMYQRRSTKWR
jgi:hypothetical protein